MAEVDREPWQKVLNIRACAIPCCEPMDGEAVAQVVQTWLIAGILPLYTYMIAQPRERIVHDVASPAHRSYR